MNRGLCVITSNGTLNETTARRGALYPGRKEQNMEIKRHRIIEEYTAQDGGKVIIIFFYPSTTVNVAAYDKTGNRIFSGVYNSRSGAMIGIGRRFGRVQFKCMTNKKGW